MKNQILIDQAVVEQALDALNDVITQIKYYEQGTSAIVKLRAALVQTEQHCIYPDCKCPTETPCLKGLTEQPAQGELERDALLKKFEIAVQNTTVMRQLYQGEVMPDAIYELFAKQRDEIIPMLRAALLQSSKSAQMVMSIPLSYGKLDANTLEKVAKQHPDKYFLKGSGVLKLIEAIRDLEQRMAALLQSKPAEPVISTEHGPWIKSKHPGEDDESYCERCLLRDKFLGSRACKPHITYAPTSTQAQPAKREPLKLGEDTFNPSGKISIKYK